MLSFISIIYYIDYLRSENNPEPIVASVAMSVRHRAAFKLLSMDRSCIRSGAASRLLSTSSWRRQSSSRNVNRFLAISCTLPGTQCGALFRLRSWADQNGQRSASRGAGHTLARYSAQTQSSSRSRNGDRTVSWSGKGEGGVARKRSAKAIC